MHNFHQAGVWHTRKSVMVKKIRSNFAWTCLPYPNRPFKARLAETSPYVTVGIIVSKGLFVGWFNNGNTPSVPILEGVCATEAPCRRLWFHTAVQGFRSLVQKGCEVWIGVRTAKDLNLSNFLLLRCRRLDRYARAAPTSFHSPSSGNSSRAVRLVRLSLDDGHLPKLRGRTG